MGRLLDGLEERGDDLLREEEEASSKDTCCQLDITYDGWDRGIRLTLPH